MEACMPTVRDMNAVSPLDGRYAAKLGELKAYAGEGALAGYRVLVECRYLRKLCETPGLKARRLTSAEKAFLEKLPRLTSRDVQRIAAIEDTGVPGIPATKHDVKAVEYFIKEKLRRTSMKDLVELVHSPLPPRT